MKAPTPFEAAALAWPEMAAGLIEGMLDAVWLVDAHDLQVVAANAAAGTLMGVAPQSLHGRSVAELTATPEDQSFWREVAQGRAESIESCTLVRRFDGSLVAVTRRVSRLDTLPGVSLFVVALHDVSEQRRIEAELESRLAELAATLESTADGILVTDCAGNIRSFNRTFATLWGLPDELVQQRNDDAVLDWMRRCVGDAPAYMRRLAAIEDVDADRATDTLTLVSGRVLERVSLPQSSRGRVIGRVSSFRDITERVEALRRVEAQSRSDALTGLPNRRVLADRVAFSMALAQRDGTPFALLHVDVDRFKHINDTLGHGFGDQVLVDVAERLKGCLRQVDTVARLDGDEFALLVHHADAHGAEATARRVQAALLRPFSHGGLSFTVTCSIGIALYPGDGAGFDELMRHAERAMHAVKNTGRASYQFHRAGAGPAEPGRHSRLKLDHAMRVALANEQFRLHYQPQVDMHSGQVLGAEALLRWRDPELGEISPAEFIPVAEQSGFIVAIGEWVLRQAVAQAAQWQSQGRRLCVSVNVSALQFQRAAFVDSVATALDEAKLPPGMLELELTESILIQNEQETLLRLQALSRLGVKLSIDDFGTGYSSLGYLKRFPIHRLKIDRSFVKGLPGDASDVGIVNAIVNLGRALHLAIVAEGVETEAQRQFLAGTGCDQYQGFLFAPALATPGFEALLPGP
jgi:diguanylate cyclase (GGDEF)-like protein/PAS domain S-box-containing protein